MAKVIIPFFGEKIGNKKLVSLLTGSWLVSGQPIKNANITFNRKLVRN